MERAAPQDQAGIHGFLSALAGDFAHLPSGANLFIAAAGGGMALAVHPFDSSFNRRLQSRSDAVNDLFAPAKYYGDTPEQVGLSIATFAVGRLANRPQISEFAAELMRAQIVDEVMTEGLKLAVGRLRPDGSNHQSFPSGHTSVTFAAATLIERRLGWKRGAIAYAVATYVAASRLHDDVHYLSDVVFGAAVGTIVGRTVAERSRGSWAIMPAAVPGGVMVAVARAR